MSETSYLKALTEDAKWGTDLEEQNRSIDLLAQYGKIALTSLEEIMVVTTHEDLKRHCMSVIKKIEVKDLKENGRGKIQNARAIKGAKTYHRLTSKKSTSVLEIK